VSSFLESLSEQEGIKAVDYEVDKDNKYESKKKKRLIIEVISILSVIVLTIFLIIFLNKIEVPNFNNQLSSVVDKWGSTNNIQIVKQEEYSNKYLEGYVIKQLTKKGTRISKKTSLEIVISKGSNPDEIIKVPNLNTISGSDIKNWINKNNLTNTNIKEENSTTIEKGKVISFSFDSVTVDSSNFKRSDVLNIIISKGPIVYEKNIEVINLVSKTKEDVSKWCTDNNLICKYTDALSDIYEINKIVSQSVKVGDVISKDIEIAFEVSVGKGIIVPNYYSTNMDNASQVNTKFEIKTKLLYNMTISYGKLISQSVEPNTKKQESDNKIELVYSLGKPYFSSIDGTSESELAKIFYDYNQKGVKFNYSVKYVNSSKTKGSVVWSSKSNEFVTMNEDIEIHVSNGNGVD